MNDLVQSSELIYITNRLESFSQTVHPLSGIRKKGSSQVLATNIVRSVYKHENWLRTINNYASQSDIQVATNNFDPLKLAAWHLKQNNRAEAWWLIFLANWFEFNDKDGWQLLQSIYFGLSETVSWNWQKVIQDCDQFGQWLINHQADLGKMGRMGGRHKQPAFDNHQAIKAKETLCFFVRWWELNHVTAIDKSRLHAGASNKLFFRNMYSYVFSGLNIDRYVYYRFLTDAGFINLIDVEPDAPFLANGSNYKKTVRQLFQAKNSKEIATKELIQYLAQLAEWLNIPFAFVVLEDALSSFFSKIG